MSALFLFFGLCFMFVVAVCFVPLGVTNNICLSCCYCAWFASVVFVCFAFVRLHVCLFMHLSTCVRIANNLCVSSFLRSVFACSFACLFACLFVLGLGVVSLERKLLCDVFVYLCV